jgi:carbonic anhydrase
VTPARDKQPADWSTRVELDKYVIAAQPDFDEPKTREEFRRFVGKLKTIAIFCFDPRVTNGIPHAVAEALPDQEYPGDLFETVDDDGKTQFGTTTTIFPVINAGGKADAGAQRSISVACHLFDIENVAIVHQHRLRRDTLHRRGLPQALQRGV